MNDLSQLPKPLRDDWFVEKLGASQQKVMSLTVQNMRLQKHVEKLENLLLEKGIDW